MSTTQDLSVSTDDAARGSVDCSAAGGAADSALPQYLPGFEHAAFNPDMPLNFRGAKRSPALGTKRDFYMVDPFALKFVPGLNYRDDDAEAQAEVQALSADMVKRGYMTDKPVAILVLEVDGVDVLFTANHTRTLAARLAIQNGASFKLIPAVPLPTDANRLKHGESVCTSMLDLQVHAWRSNTQREVSPMAAARFVMRMRSSFGLSHEEIAAIMRKSVATVRSYEQLAVAPVSVQEHVKAGRVSATRAVAAVKSAGTGAAKKIDDAVAQAKSKGKERATVELVDSDQAARAQTRSCAERLVAALMEVVADPAFESLSLNTRTVVRNELSAAGHALVGQPSPEDLFAAQALAASSAASDVIGRICAAASGSGLAQSESETPPAVRH